MNKKDFTQQIHKVGKVKNSTGEYYRFDVIIPRVVLGKGRKFEMFVKEGMENKTGWFTETCDFPMDCVEGIILIKDINGRVRLGLYILKPNIERFISEAWKVLQEHADGVEILLPLEPDELEDE